MFALRGKFGAAMVCALAVLAVVIPSEAVASGISAERAALGVVSAVNGRQGQAAIVLDTARRMCYVGRSRVA